MCGRYLLAGRSIDPITLSALRFGIGAVFLLAAGWIWRRRQITAVRWADFARCLTLAMFGIVGMSVFLFFGQQYTGAVNSSIIMQVSPIFITLLGVLIGERLSIAGFAGIFISLAGTAMVMNVVGAEGLRVDLGRGNLGDALVLAGAVCWAVYSVFSKPLVERLGGYSATTWVMAAGAMELILLRCVWSGPTVWPDEGLKWAVVLYLALFPTAIAFFAWYEAMGLIRLSLLNVMQYLTPVFTVGLAWAFLSERITLWQMAGIGVVLLGIMLVSWNPKRRPGGKH